MRYLFESVLIWMALAVGSILAALIVISLFVVGIMSFIDPDHWVPPGLGIFALLSGLLLVSLLGLELLDKSK